MFTLIATGTGSAYLYSVIATIAPDIFPDSFRGIHGEVGVYFEAATVIVALVLLGQVLELRARTLPPVASTARDTALAGITPRELTVLKLLARGLSNVAIAREMRVAESVGRVIVASVNASLSPAAEMLPPTVGTHTIELRWRGNEAAVGFDLEIRRGRDWWHAALSDRPVTSYRLRGTPGARIKVRLRARDWDAVPGAWTPPVSLRFRIPKRASNGAIVAGR